MSQRASQPAGYDGRELVDVPTREAWREWLAANHGTSPGVWFVFWRRGSGRPSVPYEAAVEEALCFGWIDSLTKRIDEHRTIQLMTPRRPRSVWSRSNKERVARLNAAGLMMPAGLAAIEAAQANGAWTQADAVDSLEEPPELTAALDSQPTARATWDGLPPSVRRRLLWWVISAKRPETRERRIATIVSESAAGRRPLG